MFFIEGMINFRKITEEVDEAISILDSGDVPECLKRCEKIAAELRKSKVVGEALVGLIEPFLIHADEYKLNERAFAEELREYLGMLRYALRQILGEEDVETH